MRGLRLEGTRTGRFLSKEDTGNKAGGATGEVSWMQPELLQFSSFCGFCPPVALSAPIYLAGHEWETGVGLEEEGGLNVLACALYGTIAPSLFLVLDGQPLPLSPPSGVTYPVGPPKQKDPSSINRVSDSML